MLNKKPENQTNYCFYGSLLIGLHLCKINVRIMKMNGFRGLWIAVCNTTEKPDIVL